MARRLIGYVPIHNSDGTTSWFGPGDDVPDWAAAQIGDHAFEAEDVADVPQVAEVPVPPHSGKGSGVAAWATYAAAHGIEFDDDASKEDIIAALVAADVPVGAVE